MKIPIHFDDFPLYKRGEPFDHWERRALSTIEASDFVVLGLHDCYADLWLPHYPLWGIIIIALDVLVIWGLTAVDLSDL